MGKSEQTSAASGFMKHCVRGDETLIAVSVLF